MIEINEQLAIPEEELSFTASRSAGPGGQHVNKVSSRITLHFDLLGSPTLTDGQKQRLTARLPTRITKRGVLQLHCQKHRSQAANRIEIVERFALLLREALRRRRPRKKTRKPRAAQEKRLEQKRRRGELKRTRRTGSDH